MLDVLLLRVFAPWLFNHFFPPVQRFEKDPAGASFDVIICLGRSGWINMSW
jgi:hypothetical protein